MLARGKLNRTICFFAPPAHGKSTLMRRILINIQSRADAGYCIVHDPNLDFPNPGVRVNSIDEIIAALNKNPKQIIAIDYDINELVSFCRELSARTSSIRGADDLRVPIHLAIDEGSVWKDILSERLGDTAEDLLARRRKHHIALYVGAQWPGLLHYRFIASATELYLGNYTSQRDLKRLEEGGVSQGILSKLKSLKRYEFVHLNAERIEI